MKFGSLFSGIGGLDLGLERAGMSCSWQVEIDPYCLKVLTKHWPDVPKFPDVRTVDFERLERVDLVAGGFPCQDISYSLGRGLEGSQSGLWAEFAHAVSILRPPYVLVENVPNLLKRGAAVVFGELSALGYCPEGHVIPASAFGAPHLRARVYIVAYATSSRRRAGASKPSWALWDEAWRTEFERYGREGTGLGEWAPEPHVGRVAHGVPRRVDRLRGLGNAVVPQVAEWIGRRILEFDSEVAA